MAKNVVVIGTQWGDEGKGKIVDWLTDHAQGVVRFQVKGGQPVTPIEVSGEILRQQIQVCRPSIDGPAGIPSGARRGDVGMLGPQWAPIIDAAPRWTAGLPYSAPWGSIESKPDRSRGIGCARSSSQPKLRIRQRNMNSLSIIRKQVILRRREN